MQHASRSLCTFICIPAVCPSLHSAKAGSLIMFQNPTALGKALITPKAHKNPIWFVLFLCNLQHSIVFFCALLHAAMMYCVENWGCEFEGFNLEEVTGAREPWGASHRLIWQINIGFCCNIAHWAVTQAPCRHSEQEGYNLRRHWKREKKPCEILFPVIILPADFQQCIWPTFDQTLIAELCTQLNALRVKSTSWTIFSICSTSSPRMKLNVAGLSASKSIWSAIVHVNKDMVPSRVPTLF